MSETVGVLTFHFIKLDTGQVWCDDDDDDVVRWVMSGLMSGVDDGVQFSCWSWQFSSARLFLTTVVIININYYNNNNDSNNKYN